MKNLSQLLLNFKNNENFDYNDFYVSKSNYFAFQLIDKWPKWEKNILNIYGEKFSGKSHLSNIFAKKHKAKMILEKDFNDKYLREFKVIQNIILDNF